MKIRDEAALVGGDVLEQRVRKMALEPHLPAEFKAVPEGSGVRLVIKDVDPLAHRSSTVRYIFGHAREADLSSTAGRRAAAERAELCGRADAPRKKGDVATDYIADARYQTGVFFCWAVDIVGNRSHEFLWSPLIIGGVVDAAIPGDVTRPQASESGRVISPGVVASQVSVSCVAPNPLGSFDRVQLYYEHYSEVGVIVAGASKVHTGEPGGTLQFQVDLAPFRTGQGQLTLTPGSKLISVAGGSLERQLRGGDWIEALDARGEVDFVTDNTTAWLKNDWAGESIVAHLGFRILPLVRLYFVSVSKASTRRPDIANAPFREVLLDALVSPPIAPTLTAASIGNGIRLLMVPVPGTDIERHTIWRAEGAGVPWGDPAWAPVQPFPQERNALTALIQYDDFDFTAYHREQGQVFCYAAVATNDRGESGPPSPIIEESPRLDTPTDSSPIASSQQNLLFNSYVHGTPGNTVSLADVSQHAYMGAPPPGHENWGTTVTGGATPAGHANETEVTLQCGLGVGGSCTLFQRIGAWDNAVLGARRIDKGRNLTLAVYARTTGGAPDGTFELAIVMLAGGVQVGLYNVKTRLSDDTFDDTAATRVFPGSDMVTEHQVYFATFVPKTIPATVEKIEVRIRLNNTFNGVNVLVKKCALGFGDKVIEWTPQLVGQPFPNPASTPPGEILDDGSRRGYIRVS